MIKRFLRPPDEIIPNEENVYLKRWYLIPKNDILNIYLHRFFRSDDDRALHDHPWFSIGMILDGEYDEVMPRDQKRYRDGTDRSEISVRRKRFRPVFRRASHVHRIALLDGADGKPEQVLTIFITGPKRRRWGFWCPKGFKWSKTFLDPHVGGCD